MSCHPLSNTFSDATQVLRDQGRVWRSLLSGEKEPQDQLKSQDYVHAAVGLVRQTSSLTWHFIWSWSPLLVPAAVLLGGLLAAMFVFLSGGSEAAGAIAAVIAGAGVSRKAFGSTLGKELRRYQRRRGATTSRAAC